MKKRNLSARPVEIVRLRQAEAAPGTSAHRLRQAEAAPGASALRRATVAGIFYSGDRVELKDALNRLMGGSVRKEKAVGVIVPHGAMRWAGGVAAAAYAAVQCPEVAVVAGPSHSEPGVRFGIGTRGGWETPLGLLPIEEALARKMLRRIPELERDDAGLREEHAVEVQLPFLQHAGVARFVPLSIGPCDAVTTGRMGEGLARTIAEWAPAAAGGSPALRDISGQKLQGGGTRRLGAPGALLVATANLSRYLPPEMVPEHDRPVVEAITAMDGEALLQAVSEKGLSMCGAEAIAVILTAAKRLGARRAVPAGYQIHRDTASAVSAAAFILQR